MMRKNYIIFLYKIKIDLFLLNNDGIDNKTFCKIFNGKLKKFKTNTFSKANKTYLINF